MVVNGPPDNLLLPDVLTFILPCFVNLAQFTSFDYLDVKNTLSLSDIYLFVNPDFAKKNPGLTENHLKRFVRSSAGPIRFLAHPLRARSETNSYYSP